MRFSADRSIPYAKSIGVSIALGVIAGFGLGFGFSQARETLVPFTPLLATSKTVMDETIIYPTAGPAKLTAGVIAMAPGQETGWHTHGVPLTGIVLEGELTVDYGDKGTRTYTQGQSIAEAIAIPHNGRNSGAGVMKLFAVYIGADGIPNATPAFPSGAQR